MPVTEYWCEYAWLPGGVAEGVRIAVSGGIITAVDRGGPPRGTVLAGLTVPGMANVHSHAFHRALRGRTHGERGTFWTWRATMYHLADRLDPDTYHRLARAVYAEMALAGYTSVGEFHYLHHGPGGTRYSDPNAMSAALVAAAQEAGIRICLLDTCYLTGGPGRPLEGVQLRFGDGDAQSWAERVDAFRPERPDVRVGAAAHSVRAVPPEALSTVAEWSRQARPVAGGRPEPTAPLHVHLSEQRGENEECLRVHGQTPTELLHRTGFLGVNTVAVHATHLTENDMSTLGSARVRVCFCPTTERDLGDGIGPARRLADAGVRLCLGGDSHAVVDAFAELGALELNERLAAEARGRFTVDELLTAATDHAALGFPDVGGLEPGAQADLVTVNLESVRTAGAAPGGVPLVASAADITDVHVAGRPIVRDGVHTRIERPAAELAAEIRRLVGGVSGRLM
ncbi:formiminoglutamate deiminase [Prauserella rugosa]|uniref:Formiminoglutamate deiminase n=1 Tax=Prauserella rugosa TaxID=43354 RepID=A0A660CL88_9PSEU|nr:formiminoglutamate deiminase [Prauserella rugosa]